MLSTTKLGRRDAFLTIKKKNRNAPRGKNILFTHDSFHLSTLTQLSFCRRHPQEKLFLPSRAAASVRAQPCQVKITSMESPVTDEPEGFYWE